jgi:hypothetical protein
VSRAWDRGRAVSWEHRLWEKLLARGSAAREREVGLGVGVIIYMVLTIQLARRKLVVFARAYHNQLHNLPKSSPVFGQLAPDLK